MSLWDKGHALFVVMYEAEKFKLWFLNSFYLSTRFYIRFIRNALLFLLLFFIKWLIGLCFISFQMTKQQTNKTVSLVA